MPAIDLSSRARPTGRLALPPGVILKPLAYDPVPTVSIVVAWKAGNTSPLVRAFVDLVRQSMSVTKDVARLTGRSRKS
jgi:hypothetical protein